jgi:phosphotransferase system HPr (HPr) family protein
MAVMMLAAAMGATVRLEIEGPDEQAALEAVAAVLAAPGDQR